MRPFQGKVVRWCRILSINSTSTVLFESCPQEKEKRKRERERERESVEHCVLPREHPLSRDSKVYSKHQQRIANNKRSSKQVASASK